MTTVLSSSETSTFSPYQKTYQILSSWAMSLLVIEMKVKHLTVSIFHLLNDGLLHLLSIGVNSVVNYTIESASISPHPFSIEPLSGVITTTAVLDRELTDSYTLIIVASDIGDQEVTATVSL